MRVDAIVNAANSSLLGGGGVDGAIHYAAGPELLEECRGLNGCPTGGAKITGGYRLPARYVIHTVGPVWQGGNAGERQLLASCYRNALALAAEYGCASVAFPLISAGAYGYPKDQAMAVATEEITRFLFEHEMMVYLVVFGRGEVVSGKKIFRDIQEYIDDVYVDAHYHPNVESRRESLWHRDPRQAMAEDQAIGAAPGILYDAAPMSAGSVDAKEGLPDAESPVEAKSALPKAAAPARNVVSSEKPDWERILKQTDEGFSRRLLRLIDEKGMSDAECYKRANVDRKLFSKIRSNPDYKPSKPTVFAFAVALELTLEETENLLRIAGFAISHSSRFDIILEYFLKKRMYNIFEINEVLFHYDMPLLGSGLH